MKKTLVILLSIIVIFAAFAACSKPTKDQPTTVPSQTVQKVEKTTTDLAKIKNGEAAELIKSYSAKELSLTDKEKKECSFLTNDSGIKIKDDYYICVIAAYMNSQKGEDGKTYTTFDHRGEYYIRYDGKQVLKKNMKNKEKDEYTELKVKEIKTTEAESKKANEENSEEAKD